MNRNYAEQSQCTKEDKYCNDLTRYVNLESGTTSLYSNTFSEVLAESSYPLAIKDGCELCTNVDKYRIALPSKQMKNEKNPELKDLVLGRAIQVNLFRFYLKGEELDDYEEFSTISNLVSYLLHLLSNITKPTKKSNKIQIDNKK